MDIEFLINLVIVVVIILAVLKRLKDVAKKGEELEAPPPAAPPAAPDMVERTDEIPQEEPVERPELPEIFKQLFGQEKPDIPGEDEFEQKPEVPEPVMAEQFQPPEEIAKPVAYGLPVIPKEEQTPRLKLSFRGSEVVRGIVMSEILGPPVGLK